jgi:hypothetical protein
MINWNDLSARAELIERVGVNEYNRLHEEHRRQAVILIALIETLSVHSIKAGLRQIGEGDRPIELLRLSDIMGFDPVRVLRCLAREYR